VRIVDIPDFYERLTEIEIFDAETGKTSLKGVSMDDERLVKLRVLLELGTKNENTIGYKLKPDSDFYMADEVNTELINELLRGRGLSNRALMELLDISNGAAWKKLNKVNRWRKEEVETIAVTYGVDIKDLLKGAAHAT
jgi:hypothetical protein